MMEIMMDTMLDLWRLAGGPLSSAICLTDYPLLVSALDGDR